MFGKVSAQMVQTFQRTRWEENVLFAHVKNHLSHSLLSIASDWILREQYICCYRSYRWVSTQLKVVGSRFQGQITGPDIIFMGLSWLPPPTHNADWLRGPSGPAPFHWLVERAVHHMTLPLAADWWSRAGLHYSQPSQPIRGRDGIHLACLLSCWQPPACWATWPGGLLAPLGEPASYF